MDPLALLSNLHGDGPSTLQRLRRLGCDALSGLAALSGPELAPVLGWELARTERFLREAQALTQRLGDGLLDVEEDAPEPVAAPEPRRRFHVLDEEFEPKAEPEREPEARPDPPASLDADARDLGAELLALDAREERNDELAADAFEAPAPRAEDLATFEPEVAEPDDDAATLDLEAAADDLPEAAADADDDDAPAPPTADEEASPTLSSAIRAEVIARWRTLDAADAAGGTADREPVDTLVPHTPAQPLTPPGRPLASAGLDGLDPVRLRALQAAGVTTVEELAAANDFELHQRTGIAFTALGRLSFLARRAAGATPPNPARPTSARAESSASRSPSRSGEGSESAGPFA